MKKSRKNKKALERDLKVAQARVHFRSGWVCENPDCDRTANGGCHHIHKRGQSGANEPYNLFDTCMECHYKMEGRVNGVVGVIFMVGVLEKIKSMVDDFKIRNTYFLGGIYLFDESLEYLKSSPSYLKNIEKELSNE